MGKLVRDMVQTMRKASESKTKPSDDIAVVQRIEGDTAWVHIPGGVDETPVQMTINCREGETVRVRRADGKAWVVGNADAPPTDDVTANRAAATAVVASQKADTAVEDAQRAHDAADAAEADAVRAQDAADSAVSNLRSVVQGATTVEKAVSVMQTALEAVVDYDPLSDTTTEYFWHDANGAHVLGTSGAYRNDITSTGMEIVQVSSEHVVAEFKANGATFKETGGTEIAHLGYGSGNAEGGGTGYAPYYNLGTRLSGSSVGNYSTIEGALLTASGYASHAEGRGTYATGQSSHSEGESTTAGGKCSHAEGLSTGASGENSHAQNLGTRASSDNQTAIGKYNEYDYNDTYAFIIGNGTSDDMNDRSNALTVKWNGAITAGGHPSGLLAEEVELVDNFTVTHAQYGNSSKSVAKTGYTPIGIVGMHTENATTSGTYNTWVCLHSYYLSGSTAYFIVRNTHASTDAKIKITATILYAKS